MDDCRSCFDAIMFFLNYENLFHSGHLLEKFLKHITTKEAKSGVHQEGDRRTMLYACNLCGKCTSTNRRHLLYHVEAEHFSHVYEYVCIRCGKNMETLQALTKHIAANHKMHLAPVLRKY